MNTKGQEQKSIHLVRDRSWLELLNHATATPGLGSELPLTKENAEESAQKEKQETR
jgi:hypothetical protein